MTRKPFITTFVLAAIMLIGILGLLHAGVATAASPPVQPDILLPDQRDSVRAAATWLVTTHQNSDGGYTAFSTGADQAPSDVAGTVDAILALAGTGYNVNALAPGQDNTPVAYLHQNGEATAAYATADGGAAGKLVLALAAANQNPRDFAGGDFVLTLTDHLSPTGQFNVTTAFNQSLALLALAAVDEPAPETAVSWLIDQQAAEGDLAGSWDDGFGTAGNPDSTAMAVMALLATGVPADDPAITAAVDFLTRAQLQSGGWEYGAGFGESVSSTALVVQALGALGLDFYTADGPFARDGVTPLAVVQAAQSETGAFQADFGEGPFDDFLTTVQAMPAVAGRAYPFPGYAEAARQAVSCLATLQDPETGGWEEFATFGVSAGGTAKAILAITAVDQDPTAEMWTVDGAHAVDALAALTPDYVTGGRGGAAGNVMRAVAAVDADPANFAGLDLAARTMEVISPTGEYDDTAFGPFSHLRAMQGLLAVGAPVEETAVDWLLNAQTDGDWGSPDSNGLALNVLSQLDMPPPETVAVLRATQLPAGGWGFDGVSPSSTSEVVQGLAAAGENPFTPHWSQIVSGAVTNPADAVLALQGENGCWPNMFGPGDDPLSTTDAVLLFTQATAVPFGLSVSGPDATMTDEAAEDTAEDMAGEAADEAVDEATEAATDETVAADPTATPEPTLAPTPEPEPTAIPTAAPTDPPSTETAVAVVGSGEATPPAAAAAEPSSGISGAVGWALAALALALMGAAAYWYTRR